MIGEADIHNQMNIFDFIVKSPRPVGRKTLLESIFGKLNDPVIQCANCLCGHCGNNAEELWSKVQPKEVIKPCFNCDECRNYTGDSIHKSQRKEDCNGFVISENEVNKRRRQFKVCR